MQAARITIDAGGLGPVGIAQSVAETVEHGVRYDLYAEVGDVDGAFIGEYLGFPGARIVAAFTDDHIRAAVARGRYSDPRAAEYLTRVLIERRDQIVRRWLPDKTVTADRP